MWETPIGRRGEIRNSYLVVRKTHVRAIEDVIIIAVFHRKDLDFAETSVAMEHH